MKKLLLATSLILLTACSASIKGGSGDDKPKHDVSPFEHKVKGPTLDGVWISDCTSDLMSGGYAQYTLTFKAQTITRAKSIFTDALCKTQNEQDLKSSTSVKGRFRFEKQYAAGYFEVAYRMDLGYAVQLLEENIRLKDKTTLFVSEYTTGEVEPHLRLKLQGSGSSEPVVTPDNPTLIPDHEPQAGDSVTLNVKTEGRTQTEVYTNKGYNTTYRDWTILIEITDKTPATKYLNDSSMWSTEKYKKTMAECVALGGVIEKTKVAAGLFETCKMTTSDGSVWYGNVPVYGVIKAQNLDGSESAELKSFSIGGN